MLGAALFLLALPLTGCDVAHPAAKLDAPKVKLLQAQVAIDNDKGTGLPTSYTALSADGQLAEVTTITSIKLRFDRFLLPTSTFRQSICVQSDMGEVKSAKDCTRGLFFESTYDPIHREIVYRQSQDPSDPEAPAPPLLAANLTYKLTVLPPSSAGPGGVQAFDGAPLDKAYTFLFSTKEDSPANAKVDAIPSLDALNVFCKAPTDSAKSVSGSLGGCSFGLCHKQDDITMAPPAEGLDMSSGARIALTAIGDTAHGTQMGEHARKGDESPPRFGRAMPIVDPLFPGNSYLLYKVLSNDANLAVLDDRPDDDEVARLRAGIVVGMPMPPSNAAAANFLDQASLDAVTTWILQGAPTECPP